VLEGYNDNHACRLSMLSFPLSKSHRSRYGIRDSTKPCVDPLKAPRFDDNPQAARVQNLARTKH